MHAGRVKTEDNSLKQLISQVFKCFVLAFLKKMEFKMLFCYNRQPTLNICYITEDQQKLKIFIPIKQEILLAWKWGRKKV